MELIRKRSEMNNKHINKQKQSRSYGDERGPGRSRREAAILFTESGKLHEEAA